ncbi:amidohydrolase family protein [Acrocarpospora macrocephala]|uniref:2-pyrone-4,6-dicarboxylate hydrolase n=1 Tax=Acrocarpospora macrocephala TaxID=150177 RepID=A0A5M3WI40_9ACTN|nr:amidohydrolase family protein [Acrocarpospora macrocephala]GES08376.1 2-pyrone-4,6-dicarboxylate hydrolase [Acrocarpospora macrocephala]
MTDSLISTAAEHGPYRPSEGNPPPHPSPRKPALALPADSCDSHCHVFGPGALFPYDKDRTFTPVDAPRQQVAALHEHLGLGRAVVIQSACNGFDHSVLLDALGHGGGRLRGVGLIDERTSPEEIARLHAAGVRGFRCNFLPHLRRAPSEAEIAMLAASVAGLGWHTEIHVQGEGVVEHERFIAALPTPVVVDHLGRIDIRRGLGQPAVRSLLRLLDTGRVYVKVSGIDRVSRQGPPYADAVELAALLVRHAPERVLWGTDFPHPNIAGDAPDDGLLVDLLAEIAPSAKLRDLLLVANPAAVFDF